MLFGTKDDFAIEAMVEPGLEPPSPLWGRLRVWISGVSIGDYEDPHCALFPAYEGFKDVIDILNQLWLPDLATMNDIEIWNYFDGRLFGFHGDEEIDVDELYGENIEYWDRYCCFVFLTNWGEMFDQDPRGKAFIFKKPNGDLKVLTRPTNDEVESFSVREFSFRKAVSDFCDWFDEQRKWLDGDHA